MSVRFFHFLGSHFGNFCCFTASFQFGDMPKQQELIFVVAVILSVRHQDNQKLLYRRKAAERKLYEFYEQF